MKETVKKFLVQETELCILLALKGVQTLYGICLDSAETMTREELYYNLFVMQKKGIIGRQADSGGFVIEGELDDCMERVRTAARFIVLADTDELVPEKYFYAAEEGAVMIEPAGQYAFHLEAVTEEQMQDRIRESGLSMTETDESIPPVLLDEAEGYWQEDKDEILRDSMVEKLLQEYDVHTQCKTKQCIRLKRGLDTYLVCSDGGVGSPGRKGGDQS